MLFNFLLITLFSLKPLTIGLFYLYKFLVIFFQLENFGLDGMRAKSIVLFLSLEQIIHFIWNSLYLFFSSLLCVL